MSEFEDNLWLAVVRERGDELARATPPAHGHGRAPRAQLLAGSAVGVAATATAAALLLGASTSSPAFAVTRNSDGTVTVTLMKASGIPGANHRLAAMGVRAEILPSGKSAPRLACPRGSVPTITFDPAGIPGREVRMIQPGATENRAGGSNHVVRLPTGGGTIRTGPRGENHVVHMYCR